MLRGIGGMITAASVTRQFPAVTWDVRLNTQWTAARASVYSLRSCHQRVHLNCVLTVRLCAVRMTAVARRKTVPQCLSKTSQVSKAGSW